MSFFRVLLALLISGGIAYGLYTVVEQQKAERASQTEVVAERAEIADTDEAEPVVDAPAEPVVEAEPETAAVVETPAEAEGEASVEEPSFEERTAEAVDVAEPVETTVEDAAAPAPATPSDAPDAPATEGDDDETDTPEVAATLPAANIEDETSGSIAALDIVTGGMTYAEARETLIGAGWTPRAIEQREDAPGETETVLIDAGYTELEGCSDAERAICRFEFVDGQKRIAAVLTAGSDADPSVIDAFLMDIAQPE